MLTKSHALIWIEWEMLWTRLTCQITTVGAKGCIASSLILLLSCEVIYIEHLHQWFPNLVLSLSKQFVCKLWGQKKQDSIQHQITCVVWKETIRTPSRSDWELISLQCPCQRSCPEFISTLVRDLLLKFNRLNFGPQTNTKNLNPRMEWARREADHPTPRSEGFLPYIFAITVLRCVSCVSHWRLTSSFSLKIDFLQWEKPK